MPREWCRFWLRDLRAIALSATVLWTASTARAQAASQFSSAILSGWSAGISATGVYEDGVQLVLGAPVKAAAFGASANAAKLWRTRHDRLEFSAGGGIRQYPSNPVLDQRNYDLNGSLIHSFSRTTTAQLGAGVSSFFVDRAITATGTGPALGRLVNLTTQSASAAFGTQIRRGYTASVSANRQEIQTSTVGLVGGTFASVGAHVIGQLSRTTNLSVSGVSQYSRFDTIGVTLPRVSATAAYIDPFGFTASLSAGIIVGSARGIPLLSRIGLGLSVGFRSRLGQFSGDLQREVGQAFGFVTGIQVTQSAGMGYTRQITRAWTTGARASIGSLSTVQVGAPRTSVSQASINTSFSLARGAAISIGAFANKFGGGAQNFSGRGINTTISYGWAQRRRGEPAAR